jgi:hypothetical protein
MICRLVLRVLLTVISRLISDGENNGENNSEDEYRDEQRVMVEYGREGDHFDVETGVLERTVGFSLFQGGELLSSSVSIAKQRQFTLQELDLLAELTGWTMLQDSVFGDFDSGVSLEDDDADRMICIFIKST